MWKTSEGSTGRLLELCSFYFLFYVITGVSVKYFLGKASLGFPGMNGIEFLVYSTLGGTAVCLLVVLLKKWYRLKSYQKVSLGGTSFPLEYLYIIPSGICTAVVIPTTTLMYTLPISVMVAMVIMRASVIVISRVVDTVQIRQGILQKRVYPEENIAVVFALIAAGINIFWYEKGNFEFLHSTAAMGILGCYLAAYAIRIYIMNYYKNTRPPGVKLDNQGFFGIEQIAASATLSLVAAGIYYLALGAGVRLEQIKNFHAAIVNPKPAWDWAIFAGTAYGMVAFFSVFLFMFQGRTATFAGLVNRLTSLVAGTVATLIFYLFFSGKFPGVQDWISLIFIFIAVAFLARGEKKRTAELALSRMLDSLASSDHRPVLTRQA